MPGGASRASAKKPAPRQRKPRFDPQAAFAAAMIRWFEESGYHVGLDLDQFDGDEAREQFKKLADKLEELAAEVLHHVVSFHALVSSGANSDDLFEALTPFIGQADIVASKVGSGLQTGLVVVPLVLFADKLAPEEIRRRFSLFVELGEALNAFGPRLNRKIWVSAGSFRCSSISSPTDVAPTSLPCVRTPTNCTPGST